MNTLFIETLYPTRLLIAVLVKDPEYHNAYEVAEIEYGMDFIKYLEESPLTREVSVPELPEALTEVYLMEYKRGNNGRVWTHIN